MSSPAKRLDLPVRLRIIYEKVGWAYYYRALALAKHAPDDFSVSLAGEKDEYQGIGAEASDVVFLINYKEARETREALRRMGSGALLVTSFNTGWPRRRELFETCREVCDTTIVNNLESWKRAGRKPGTFHISNGVDLSVFRATTPPAERKPRVLWCGSTRHRELKGFDEFLVPMARRLAELGIESDFFLTEDEAGRHLRSQDEMARWYNTGTIYVCASELEGTPNPALEAAACGCAVVSTPVGNMPELVVDGLNGYLVERRVEALVDGVLRATERYRELSTHMLRSIRAWDWRMRSREYYGLFRELWRGRAHRG